MNNKGLKLLKSPRVEYTWILEHGAIPFVPEECYIPEPFSKIKAKNENTETLTHVTLFSILSVYLGALRLLYIVMSTFKFSFIDILSRISPFKNNKLKRNKLVFSVL